MKRIIQAIAMAAILSSCSAKMSVESKPGVEAKAIETIQELDRLTAVVVIKDDKRGVTCWVVRGPDFSGIDCITNDQLLPQPIEWPPK